MKITYSQLCSIREITNKYDLEDLDEGCGCPPDEYHSEVDMMIEQFESADVSHIQKIIFDVFGKMFDSVDFNNKQLNYKNVPQMANEISKVLLQTQMTEVVAAIIWDRNRFMICQRPANKARGLLWELVGGKVEPGETRQQALIRECREELAVTLSIGSEFMDVVHEYPDITVHLTLFYATIDEGVPRKLEHKDIRWITPEEIPQYEFCPADELILERLKQQW